MPMSLVVGAVVVVVVVLVEVVREGGRIVSLLVRDGMSTSLVCWTIPREEIGVRGSREVFELVVRGVVSRCRDKGAMPAFPIRMFERVLRLAGGGEGGGRMPF